MIDMKPQATSAYCFRIDESTRYSAQSPAESRERNQFTGPPVMEFLLLAVGVLAIGYMVKQVVSRPIQTVFHVAVNCTTTG